MEPINPNVTPAPDPTQDAPPPDDRMDLELQGAIEDRDTLEALQAAGITSPGMTAPREVPTTPEDVLVDALSPYVQPVLDDLGKGLPQVSKIVGGGAIKGVNAMVGAVDNGAGVSRQRTSGNGR